MVLLAISYFLNVADYLFTLLWVHLYGIDAEANPFGRWIIQSNLGGFIKIVVMAGLFFLLGILIKRCPKAKYAIHIVFGSYCIITLCHIALALYIFSPFIQY